MISLLRFRPRKKQEESNEAIERRSVKASVLELLHRRRVRVRRRPSSNGTVNEEDEEAGDTSSYYDDSRTEGVRFQLDCTEYHEDTARDLDCDEEWENCWYTSSELRQFKLEQMQTTQYMFEDTYRLESEEKASKALEWQTVLKQAFDACLGVSDLVMANLEKLYRDNDHCLVGLEASMLARMRGKSIRLRRTIMQHLSPDQKMPQQQQQPQTSQGPNTAPLCCAIASITAPTASFAHLVAVAQARALQAEDRREE